MLRAINFERFARVHKLYYILTNLQIILPVNHHYRCKLWDKSSNPFCCKRKKNIYTARNWCYQFTFYRKRGERTESGMRDDGCNEPKVSLKRIVEPAHGILSFITA